MEIVVLLAVSGLVYAASYAVLRGVDAFRDRAEDRAHDRVYAEVMARVQRLSDLAAELERDSASGVYMAALAAWQPPPWERERPN